MVFQIALDFVPHLVDRDPLDGRRQLFEDVLRLDSGPFGNDAEYGQSKIADILSYFVIYFVILYKDNTLFDEIKQDSVQACPKIEIEPRSSLFAVLAILMERDTCSLRILLYHFNSSLKRW